MTARRDLGRRAVGSALAALLAGAAFLPVVGNGLIDGDDRVLFVDDLPRMQAPPAEAARWAITETRDYWYPLTRLSHVVVAQCAGAAPWAHHLASLLLHAANAALLFLLLSTATGSFGRSLLVAALFAVHPIQTESVAWVVQRSTVLSASLAFLSVGAHVRCTRRATAGRQAAVAVLFTLGLMAKPILVTLPLVLLLVDFWPLGRFRPGGPAGSDQDAASARSTAWHLLAEKTPLLAISAVFSVITVVTQASFGSIRSLGELSLGARLLGIPLNYLRYLGQMLAPHGLHPYHLFATAPSWGPPFAAALFLGALTLLAWRRRGLSPWLVAGWGWFLTLLVPVSGLLQVGSQSYAERYAYLSGVGLLVALAWSLPPMPATGARARLATAALALLIASGVALSLRQSRLWHDTGTLLAHAVASDPDNAPLRDQRAAHAYRRLDFDTAIHDLLYLVTHLPSEAVPRFNLALVLETRGDLEPALHHLERAAALNPGEPEYGRLLGQWSARREAAAHDVKLYSARVRENPSDLAAQRELGAALFELGRHEEAARQFRVALEQAPGQPDVAALLDRAQRLRPNPEEEAFRRRETATAARPGLPDTQAGGPPRP